MWISRPLPPFLSLLTTKPTLYLHCYNTITSWNLTSHKILLHMMSFYWYHVIILLYMLLTKLWGFKDLSFLSILAPKIWNNDVDTITFFSYPTSSKYKYLQKIISDGKQEQKRVMYTKIKLCLLLTSSCPAISDNILNSKSILERENK